MRDTRATLERKLEQEKQIEVMLRERWEQDMLAARAIERERIGSLEAALRDLVDAQARFDVGDHAGECFGHRPHRSTLCVGCETNFLRLGRIRERVSELLAAESLEETSAADNAKSSGPSVEPSEQ